MDSKAQVVVTYSDAERKIEELRAQGGRRVPSALTLLLKAKQAESDGNHKKSEQLLQRIMKEDW